METVFAHFEGLSRQFLGYELPQVLILHANELNADFLPDLVQMLRARTYTFVSLDEAKGLTMQPEPLEPPFVRELFDAVQR